MPETPIKSYVPPSDGTTMFPPVLEAPDKENTIPALERKEFIQGVLDKRTGALHVKGVGGDAETSRRLLELILAELQAHTKILNHLAGTSIESEGLA